MENDSEALVIFYLPILSFCLGALGFLAGLALCCGFDTELQIENCKLKTAN
jgi:hypothetical protein